MGSLPKTSNRMDSFHTNCRDLLLIISVPAGQPKVKEVDEFVDPECIVCTGISPFTLFDLYLHVDLYPQA